MKLIIVLWLSNLLVAEYIPPGPHFRCPKQYLLLYPCSCDKETDQGIYINCNNTNLATMSIGLNNLATYELPIEQLVISHSKIARLYGSLLYKLKVRVLKIEETPIEYIDEHTFLGVNNTLNELYIINSSLKEFPSAALKILGNLTILNIDNHKLSELPKDAFIGSELAGRLLKFYLSNGNISSISIESLQPLRKLKTLDLHSNQIYELKRNQFKGLRDVEFVDLSYNFIPKVDSSHLGDLAKLVFFNISHNNITELTRGAFARNTVLRVLNVSFNKIKRLDTNSFKGMRFLRRLFLSDNEIFDISRGTFSSLTKIGTIDLARNFIKKIDYQMFYQLKLIEIINLSENNITEIQKLAFKDIYLTDINLSKNNISKIESGAFENCANITKLDLSHNNIRNIPKKAWDETTYATELHLSYNFLTVMNQIPLSNMTGLKILNVSYNQIQNIPKGTFPKLYELHTIDLSHNNVSEIFNSVFQTLFSLRNLNMSFNNLSSLKPSTFGPLPTILDLDLSYNHLDDIAKSCFTRLSSTRRMNLKGNQINKLFLLPISVSHLDLSYNQFEEIPPKQWPSMNSLLNLDLSYNKLGNGLFEGSFANLLTLQMLNLSCNGFSSPPWVALNELTSLQFLYIQDNNITTLNRAAFGRIPVLFELNLANNNINNISSKAFDGLLQLIKLNLSNNQIAHIPNGAFQGLVSLNTLDLSHNKIEKLDNKTHGLFDDCLSLETLILNNNKISFITRKTFPNNPYFPYKLKNIDLSYNSMPLLTYDLVFGTSKVEKLNLSHNAITDVRRGVIGNLTSLISLDLSFNKLEDLTSEKEFFHLPNSTKAIYLMNNQLKELPWKYLLNLTHLEILDIRNNQFKSIGLELTRLAENNTNIYFLGNPLNCDCFLLPIKRYFSSKLILKDFYKSIKCTTPSYLFNQKLYEISEDRLNCPTNVNISRIKAQEPELYDITPDLRFRDILLEKNKLKIKWRVMKNDDIGDTYIVIKDLKHIQNIVYEKNLPYFKRSWEIDILGDFVGYSQNNTEYQVCLLARDSKTFVRGLHQEQCQDLPKPSVGNRFRTSNVISILIMILYILSV